MKPGSTNPKKKNLRAKGEGTFEQLKSGRWSCYSQVMLEGRKRKIRGLPAATKEQAAKNLKIRLDEERKGLRRASGLSLTKLADRWLQSAPLATTTRETCACWIRSLEADPLGQMPARKIVQADLDGWLLRMKIQKRANSTIRKRAVFWNQILTLAGSPCRIPVPPKEDHERRPLSTREREFLDSLVPPEPWMGVALLICRELGLRRSEAFGLRHEDRDGDGIWINRVVLLGKGKLIVRSKTKTPKSRAWIPLSPKLREIIGSGSGYVIADAESQGKAPMNPKPFSWWLYTLKADTILGRVPHFGAHTLRRTYGMQLLETGTDLVTAAEMMRHDVKTLGDEYARSREDLKRAAAERAFGA